MPPKKTALGKGLGALLPSAANKNPKNVQVSLTPKVPLGTDETYDGARLMRLPVSKVIPNPDQPRKEFTEAALSELSQSLRRHGMIQPIAVTRRGDKWMIVAGERRWRAAQLAGFETIPSVEIAGNELEVLEFALVENLQREDLNPIDEARAYQLLMKKFSLTQEDVASRVGKGRATVTNALRLLKLAPEIQKEISEGRLSSGHARAILSLPDRKRQQELHDLIIKTGMNVRQAEQKAALMQSEPEDVASLAKSKTSAKQKTVDINARHLQDLIEEKMSCRVKVIPKDNRSGKIEIHYTTLDELDRIMAVLKIKID